MNRPHIPVMLKECLDLLINDKSGIYFDATLGFAGHSSEILKRLNLNGKLIATEIDTDAFEFSRKKFIKEKRISLYNFNYSLIDVIAKIESIQYFDGILADLGVSSYQLDNPRSGFTFRKDVPLDLRMDKTNSVSASEIVNSFSEEDLSRIFFEFGEERNSRKIARSIIDNRSIKAINSTGQLVTIIEKLVPSNYLKKTLSRVFQALRIYINSELENLKIFLAASVKLLRSGGRIVILSYHSLEDRIVKEFFKSESGLKLSPKEDPLGIIRKEARIKLINKKPLLPTDDEINLNYRARSAKLRVAEKL